MPSTLEYALATAIAKAAMQGDSATVRTLLEACGAAGSGAETFADGTKKRGWGMKFGGLISWLTGKKAAEKRHASEHEKQRAAFEVDDVQDAQTLTESEQQVYDGNQIHTPFSSCVWSIRYDKGDGRGSNTKTYITFKPSGDMYVYYDVPFSTVMDEINTDSAGRGVWRWFREGTPPYKSLYGGRKVGNQSLTKGESKHTAAHILRKGKKKP